MSLNKLNCASAFSVNGPSHGRINGFVQDQNEPRANGLGWLDSISSGSKSGRRPQSRASQVGGLHSRGTSTNQLTHNTRAFGSHRVPSHEDGSPGRAVEPEQNFLDLALEESSEGSDNDEWEEVACPANAVSERLLIAASSGFTFPIRGKRSDLLTLEVIEDWQPSYLPPAPHADDVHVASHEHLDHCEADLQLEAELAEGLANLNTPAPGPSRQSRSYVPASGKDAVSASSLIRLPTHLSLEVVEQPSPTRPPVKGKGKAMDRESAERPRKIGERINHLRASSAIDDQPTRKPTVSFKKKATELARSTGRLLTPSKPLPPRNPTDIPSPTTGDPSSAPNNPSGLRAQVAPDSSWPTPQLFTPKGFLNQVQVLREKQAETTLRRFDKRYGGIIVEHARRDLTDLMSAYTHTRSSDASKGTQPTKRHQVQRTMDGRRTSKAQAEAEEVMKICRSTKSYVVDLAAIRRRKATTLPEHHHPAPTTAPPSILPTPVRSEKVAPGIASQQVSKTRPAGPSPTPRLSSTSSGSVPQGLKFPRKQRPAPEPGDIAAETAGRVVSSERSVRVPRLAPTSRGNGPRRVGASKRRWEDLGRESEGSSRKKPRLGLS